MSSIPEKDWKKIRAMKDKLLNIACEKIFKKIEVHLENRDSNSHKAYLQLWNILKKEDDEISIMCKS